MNADRRRYRRETQLLSSESAWLQKALFALQKAEGSREKLAESRGQEDVPFDLATEAGTISLEDVQEGLENRIRELLDEVRGRRRSLR